ncbi:hypothetical protein ACS127_01615 [Amphibacillus sp. Q70]|uniref:hypothetical protein n=1 Tax=Amphibacillus sp. Q70 TaxID=3453416 RepID=UPI003F830861
MTRTNHELDLNKYDLFKVPYKTNEISALSLLFYAMLVTGGLFFKSGYRFGKWYDVIELEKLVTRRLTKTIQR